MFVNYAQLGPDEWYVEKCEYNHDNPFQLTKVYTENPIGRYKGDTYSHLKYPRNSRHGNNQKILVPDKEGEFTNLNNQTYVVEYSKGKVLWCAIKPNNRPNWLERIFLCKKKIL